MLTVTELELSFSKSIQIISGMGSVMHGALMDCISKEAASYLHQITLRPYSQSIYWDKLKKTAIWRIGTLNEAAYKNIITPLQQIQSFYLKHKQCDVAIKSCKIIGTISYNNLAEFFMQQNDAPLGGKWQFLNTVSFKQSGQYVNFPDARLIYQSLINRWNAFSPSVKLEGENLAEELSKHCRLTRYNLYSQVFPIEGQKIHGFGGRQQYLFYGYDMLKRLQGLLTAFAPYAGVGIKTALGMGAVTTKVLYKKG